MKKVVFLDYDGVVNNIIWNPEGTKANYGFPKEGKVNDFQAVQWVSEFCQKFGYDIVVSSSWRSSSNWKACLINGGLREGINVLGCITRVGHDRGEQIKEYLRTHPEIRGYLIFDDEKIKDDELSTHTVLCTHDGFKHTEFCEARSLHELYYSNLDKEEEKKD